MALRHRGSFLGGLWGLNTIGIVPGKAFHTFQSFERFNRFIKQELDSRELEVSVPHVQSSVADSRLRDFGQADEADEKICISNRTYFVNGWLKNYSVDR